jgi:hypothetical protein
MKNQSLAGENGTFACADLYDASLDGLDDDYNEEIPDGDLKTVLC